MGYVPVARHKTKNITVYRQGDINYLINEEPGTHGFNFVAAHGPCAPSMAFRVVDAKLAYERAISLGAEPADIPSAQKTLDVPAIKGIGGSLLYFVDRYGAKGSAYEREFEWLGARDPRPAGAGLFYIDHLTHNVHRGRMDVWTGFYAKLFNFRQIRFFDIEGRASGLFSRALTSPDGKIRIPINEDAGDSGQALEGISPDLSRRGHPARRAGRARSLRLDRDVDRARRRVHAVAQPTSIIRAPRQTSAQARRASRPPQEGSSSSTAKASSRVGSPRCCCNASRQDRDRTNLLRVHPTQGRRRFRRGQFQGPV